MGKIAVSTNHLRIQMPLFTSVSDSRNPKLVVGIPCYSNEILAFMSLGVLLPEIILGLPVIVISNPPFSISLPTAVCEISMLFQTLDFR